MLCVVVLFCLMGFSKPGLEDIQKAIIQKDYIQAKELAKHFIGQNPNRKQSDEAHYYLGLSLLYLGDFSQAREVFTQLIRYKPIKVLRDKAYLGVVDSLLLEGNYKEAINMANKVLRKRPKTEFESLVYLKLARANLKLANWKNAKKYLSKIINKFPNSLEVYVAKQLMDEKQYFAVQIGSFLERGRAEDMAAILKQKGEYAYIVETLDRAGRKFYRVRVGELSRLSEAKRLENKLADLGYPTLIYP